MVWRVKTPLLPRNIVLLSIGLTLLTRRAETIMAVLPSQPETTAPRTQLWVVGLMLLTGLLSRQRWVPWSTVSISRIPLPPFPERAPSWVPGVTPSWVSTLPVPLVLKLTQVPVRSGALQKLWNTLISLLICT